MKYMHHFLDFEFGVLGKSFSLSLSLYTCINELSVVRMHVYITLVSRVRSYLLAQC